jgi:hypothetical protein
MNEVEITRRLAHVEKELATHSTVLAANAESMKNLMERSDERLEYIKERFDNVDRLVREESTWAASARTKLIGAASATFCAFVTAVWFVVVSPIQDQLAVLDRRVIDAEKRIAVHMHDDTPE